MSDLNVRWLLIGWHDNQPILFRNGKPRVYHSLKQATAGFKYHNQYRLWDRETKQYRTPERGELTDRIAELTFTDEGVTGRYVTDQEIWGQ